MKFGGVEGGGPGGIGVAPSLPGIVSEGPAGGFGSLASLGHELRAPSVFMNDRSVKGLKGGLENTMPLAIGAKNPISEIRFDLNASDAILEAQSILGQVPRFTPGREEVPAVFQRAFNEDLDPGLNPSAVKIDFFAEPVAEIVVPQKVSEPQIVPDVVSIEEARARVKQLVTVQPAINIAPMLKTDQQVINPMALEQPIEEAVEVKEEVTEKDKEDETVVKQSGEPSEYRVKFVEAVEISNKRKWEIKSAIKKLGKGVRGRSVIRFLSEGFWNATSPIAKNGKDRTINLTAHSIEADTTEYKTEEEAEKALVRSVDKHIPVKAGEGGRRATYHEVKKVISGEETEILRPKTLAEVVVKRIAKKVAAVGRNGETVKILENTVDTDAEPTIADLNLEDVFPKVA